MDFIFKETKLTAGSTVNDIQILANGAREFDGKPLCIFSCTSERDAVSFLAGLEKLVDKHTLESLDEIK